MMKLLSIYLIRRTCPGLLTPAVVLVFGGVWLGVWAALPGFSLF